MKIRKIRVYGYNELDSNIQRKALAEYKVDLPEEWDEHFYAEVRLFLKLQGITFIGLEHSDFAYPCKDDGARITCILKDTDIPQAVGSWHEEWFEKTVEKDCRTFRGFGSFWHHLEQTCPDLVYRILSYVEHPFPNVEFTKVEYLEKLDIHISGSTSIYCHENTLLPSTDIGEGILVPVSDEVMNAIQKDISLLEERLTYYIKMLSRYTFLKLRDFYEELTDEKEIIEGLVRLGEVFSRNGVYIADEIMKPDTTGV